MKKAAILLAFLVLSGCLPTKEQDVASCRVEAYQAFGQRAGEDLFQNSSNYTYQCMLAKGYQSLHGEALCKGSYSDQVNASCYERNASWGSIVDDIEDSILQKFVPPKPSA